MSHFAIIQTGAAVFGTGASKEEAMQSAIQWLDDSINTVEELESAINNHDGINGIECRSCTVALHNYAQEFGGDIVWGENENGELCLESEVE